MRVRDNVETAILGLLITARTIEDEDKETPNEH